MKKLFFWAVLLAGVSVFQSCSEDDTPGGELINTLDDNLTVEVDNAQTRALYIQFDETQAKTIALAKAGLTATEITNYHCELEFINGIFLYDVDFKCNGYEYECEINARSGKIVSYTREVDDDTLTETEKNNANYITVEKARSIALDAAGLSESQVTFLKVELDRENGTPIYEVEFYVGNKEYDYEINALTGAIISVDYDIESYTPPISSTSTYITETQAKNIALNHAGLSESQVTFLKVKMDIEDGTPVYEVEFYEGNREFDYEIDALTGAIIEVDTDVEDFTPPGTGGTTYITRDEAKAIALQRAELTEAQIRKYEIEFENGTYEIEFEYGYYEYECVINATTGSIVKFTRERD